MFKIKKIILISILVILFLFVATGVGFSANISQEIINFIDDWNENVKQFEKEWSKNNYNAEEISKGLYLETKDLKIVGGSNENYNIELFEGYREKIELSISYNNESNTVSILIINEQKSSKDIFVKDNLLAIHAGEVLIYTLKNDKEAEEIINQLRLYKFWGKTFTDLGVSSSLESDEFGEFYDIWLDEFSVGILFDDDQSVEDYFEIGYMGPLN